MSDERNNETHQDDQPERAMCVRLPVETYRAVRTVAVTRDLTNAQVLTWAIELLDRHVHAGGER